MSESEDGVKYETEKKELEFRLNQLEETHKYITISSDALITCISFKG